MRIINTYREPVLPDDPMTAEEILDLCCSPVPFDPCAKTGRISDYDGAEQKDWNFDPDQLLEQARADNPGKRIISVRTESVGNRPGQPCGKKYEEWTGRNNCCDFVEPMAWDGDSSAEVVAPGMRVMVGVTGGAPPYHWSVRGEGFTLDGYNLRDGFTDTPYVWIHAGPFACGWAPIEVTDGCSVVKRGVRSTEGSWVLQESFSPSCEIKNAGIAGLFPCSASGYPYYGPSSVTNGEYWAGPGPTSGPYDIAPMFYYRESHSCGIFAMINGPDTIYLPAPGSDDTLLFPMLHSFGEGSCIPEGGGSVFATLYWWVGNSATYRWRC